MLSLSHFNDEWMCVLGNHRTREYLKGKVTRSRVINQRQHVAAVWTANTMKVFVDGKLQMANTIPPNLQLLRPQGPLLIGLRSDETGKLLEGFAGRIDEVRISRSARYDNDFSPGGRFPTDADTLALYHFDQGTGDVLKDSSGNNSHGKIVGAKWVQANGGAAVNDDPDRRAATYILSVGGKVGINEIPQEYSDVRELPKSRFRLTSIKLHDCQQVSAAGLAACRGCQHLTQFQLSVSARVGDSGLEPFRQCKKLTSLALAGTSVTDAGLAYFSGCRDLTALSLHEHLVTDLGLENFKDCRKLESLGLAHAQMTEKGLGDFQNCRNLQSLSVRNTPVGDGAFALLKNFPKLVQLDFGNDQMTNARLASLPNLKDLTMLILSGTQINDAGVKHLKKLTTLTKMNLENNKLTPAGLAELKKALPNCTITSDIAP